ncbi:major royal jelly protein [Pontibacter ummariensis]|uniref:Major royal jelly protein n=1 Tax=Pontibacter ummariensis TaxID=1610492 RepID=A0A239K1C3_9BACT|nr:L-dopachrome tautomerase-related protein [Pontibacter ummariensis]PRY06814.1 major royal jelly protein [Pontibacter ummariensis]SNT11548.1 Major royal jelly protein [Pontibacter ummariensis]
MKRLLTVPVLGMFLLASCSQTKPEAEAEAATTQELQNEAIAAESTEVELTKVATFKSNQVTGVTMTEDGRLFANFPRWREDVPFSVVEVMPDGTPKPYPNEAWNSWTGQPQPHQFTSVQSVVAHDGSLYVLDPANPMFKGVVGNAKLYEFDLATNTLKNTWEFDRSVAPEQSYLNDLRLDDERGKIYMTDSGLGAIVVLDPATGKARRLLDNHVSTKAENVFLNINGEKWLRNGQQPQIHSDGIALSPDNDSLYYHALTGYTLYRVPTDALANASLREAVVEEKVQSLGNTPAPDGMIFDERGNLYMADLERDAIVYRTPSGEIKTLVQDPRIDWADTFTIGPDEMLYFTTSKLAAATGDISNMTFEIYKVPLAKD